MRTTPATPLQTAPQQTAAEQSTTELAATEQTATECHARVRPSFRLSCPEGAAIVPAAAHSWRVYQQIRLQSARHDGPAFGRPLALLAAKPASFWRAEVQKPGRYLAMSNGHAVGVIAVDHYTSGPYVCNAWVSPPWRGTGLTGCLVQKCVDFAVKQGFPVLHAGVFVSNPLGRKVFEKLGFSHDGVLRNSCEASGDWIKLSKHLMNETH